MKTVVLLALFITSSHIFAQEVRPWRRTKSYDFSKVDAAKLDEDKIYRQVDSLYHVLGIDSLQELAEYVRLKKPFDGYSAFVIGVEFGKHSFKTLNKKLSDSGFEPITETLPSFNWGMDFATKRWLTSLFLSVKAKEKTRHEDVSLSIASGGVLSISVGYDLVNHERVKLYPLAGLTYQKFTIDIRNKGIEYDQGFGYYLTNFYQSSYRQRSLAGQAGVELDIFLTKPEVAGVILMIRAGVQKTIINGEFRQHHHGYDFDFKDDSKESFLSVGVKFFGR